MTPSESARRGPVSRVKSKRSRPSKHDQPPGDQSLPEVLLAGEPDIVSRWPILLLVAVSWVISLPLFAPWGFWPSGYAVFVPWLLAIALSPRAGWTCLVSYLFGAAFYLMHWRWLAITTVEGYLLGSLLYMAPLFIPVAWLIRHLHRTRGWPLAFAFPFIWVAQELAHSRGPLAFPWFLLGHSQYRFRTAVQIADLAGVYGLSFVLAAVNGLIADLLLKQFFIRRRGRKAPAGRSLMPAAAFAGALLLFMLVYGQYRLHQSGPADGPRVAVIQGDFPLVPYNNPGTPSDDRKRLQYFQLAEEALADQPDLLVLPETPWAMYLNGEALADAGRVLLEGLAWASPHDAEQIKQGRAAPFIRRCMLSRTELAALASASRTPIVIGAMSMEKSPSPSADPPFHKYNSAFVFTPDAAEPARYDKINLVLFGEYVPFRYTWKALYRFLNDGPWNIWGVGGNEYSLTPGREHATFPPGTELPPEMQSRFGVTICYEDVIPQVFRRFILDAEGRKRVGFMLNISNDGWFGYGTQQAQHLVNCAFRAVENRVGIARSVNTGISGFIRPDGSIYELVGNGRNGLRAGGEGFGTAVVLTDPRVTLYSRIGDALPAGLSIVALAACVDASRSAWKNRRASRKKRRRGRKDIP